MTKQQQYKTTTTTAAVCELFIVTSCKLLHGAWHVKMVQCYWYISLVDPLLQQTTHQLLLIWEDWSLFVAHPVKLLHMSCVEVVQ
jgi:hypothetical protein